MATRRPSRDLLWVLGVALAIRFYHSDAPLLGTNSWRQCDNASVARNYAAPGSRFMRPTVSWAGVEGPPGGVVQMEFPVYQFVVGRLYRVLGENDRIGRWISIVAALLAIVFLHGLVADVAGARPAAWAAFVLAVLPLNAYYGRAFMVESAMLAALIGGVWFFDRWLHRGGSGYFWLSASLIGLACLLKVVSLYIGLPLAWLAWRRWRIRFLTRPAIWGFAVLVLVPVAWWYAWSGHLLAESGISFMGDWRYGTDKWGDWKLAATGAFWNRILFARLAGKHLTWAGFAIFAWGLLLKRRRRAAVFDAWLVAVLVATAIASRGSWVHEHYQLWFVPPAAAIMGRTFGRKWRARLWRSPSAALVTLLLAGLLVMSAWRYLALSAGESPEEAESWRLAMIIRDHTEPGDFVVSMDNKDPTALYHARRRGWNAHVNDLAAGGDPFLRGLAARGAGFLAARHDEFMVPDRTALARRLLSRYRVVDDNGAVFILKLGRR